MSSEEKLRKEIVEIIQRPQNVRFEEIDRVLKALGCPEPRKTKHGWLYAIPGAYPLMLNDHNNGKDKLPRYCVVNFRDRMIEIGLYE